MSCMAGINYRIISVSSKLDRLVLITLSLYQLRTLLIERIDCVLQQRQLLISQAKVIMLMLVHHVNPWNVHILNVLWFQLVKKFIRFRVVNTYRRGMLHINVYLKNVILTSKYTLDDIPSTVNLSLVINSHRSDKKYP